MAGLKQTLAAHKIIMEKSWNNHGIWISVGTLYQSKWGQNNKKHKKKTTRIHGSKHTKNADPQNISADLKGPKE